MIFTTYARQPSPVRSHRLHLSFYLLESYVSRWMLLRSNRIDKSDVLIIIDHIYTHNAQNPSDN